MLSLFVEDCMDGNPHALSTSATVRDAINLFTAAHIPGAPVIDENKHLVGYISEQDCLKEMLNDAFYSEQPPFVTQVMNYDVKTVAPMNSVLEVAEAMSKTSPKNYPVVENGRLVGMVSRSRILKSLSENNKGDYFHH
ncbi:CBS domain-containing protein [Alteromonadaceae bacterium 2753L.S.0a.02]|nr:CBS domain-containing protein [Alteromonadaceae bacterium 2753L.S.0a.02]